MNKLLLLIFLQILDCLSLQAQNYVFQKVFCDLGDQSKYSDFIILPSGSLFWVGSENNDAQITKLNKDFSTQWKKMFGGSDFDGFRSINYIGDNRLVITGQSKSIDGDVIGNYTFGKNAWICIVDTNGNILHQTFYGGSSSSVLKFTKVAPNGDLYFCSSTSGDTLDYSASAPFDFHDDGFIACTDSLLNKKFLHFFDVVNGDSYVEDLDFLPNGHLIIVATSNVLDGSMSINTPTSKGATVIMEIDTFANIYWQKRYGSMGGSNVGGTIRKIFKDPNKWEYMLLGNCTYKDGDCWDAYSFLNKYGSNYMWFMKVDTLGNKVWSHIFGSFADSVHGSQEYYLGFNYITNNGLVTCATDGNDNHFMGGSIGKADTWSFQVDMDGQLVKNFRVGYHKSAWVPRGAKSSPFDNKIYYIQRMYVDTSNYYQSYPHVCDTQKLKEFTILGWYEYWPNVISENTLLDNRTFKIYPNPAYNIVNFENLLVGGILEIHNVNGIRVYRERILNTSLTLPVGNWQDGIYTATLTKNKKRETQKFSIY